MIRESGIFPPEKGGPAIHKLLRAATRILDWFYWLLVKYSQAVLFFIVVLVFVMVVLRKLFRHSLVWTEEVSLLLIVWMAFITMAIGVVNDRHIVISFFYDLLPRRIRSWVSRANHLLIAAAGVGMAYFGTRLILYSLHSTLPTTRWPTFVLYLMIPVAGIYIAIFSLGKLLRGNRKDGPREGGEGSA